MILAIDIGNTTVALGGIQDGSVCFLARMDTVRTRTVVEYSYEMKRILLRYLEKPISFEGVAITSVVPQITEVLMQCARQYTDADPVVVSPDIRTGLIMGVPHPRALGNDRIVDAAYAAAHFPLPVITVDLGTATTFNVVDENRVFRGGVICSGLATGLNALEQRCAQLPQVQLVQPQSAIGQDTVGCMLSGSVIGAAVLLDGMAERIEEELGKPASLVVTGGLAEHVVPLCRHPLTYDPELLLKGLGYLYKLNADKQE
jgi:type III pantothenate kinase